MLLTLLMHRIGSLLPRPRLPLLLLSTDDVRWQHQIATPTAGACQRSFAELAIRLDSLIRTHPCTITKEKWHLPPWCRFFLTCGGWSTASCADVNVVTAVHWQKLNTCITLFQHQRFCSPAEPWHLRSHRLSWACVQICAKSASVATTAATHA